jgi:hypothetical protein
MAIGLSAPNWDSETALWSESQWHCLYSSLEITFEPTEERLVCMTLIEKNQLQFLDIQVCKTSFHRFR